MCDHRLTRSRYPDFLLVSLFSMLYMRIRTITTSIDNGIEEDNVPCDGMRMLKSQRAMRRKASLVAMGPYFRATLPGMVAGWRSRSSSIYRAACSPAGSLTRAVERKKLGHVVRPIQINSHLDESNKWPSSGSLPPRP